MRSSVALLGLLAALPLAAQPRPALSAADYARAEQFLSYNVNPLVFGSGVRPTWLPDGKALAAIRYDVDGSNSLWLLSLDGSSIEELAPTREVLITNAPGVSPDSPRCWCRYGTAPRSSSSRSISKLERSGG